MSHHEAGRRFGIDRRTVKKMLSYSAPDGSRLNALSISSRRVSMAKAIDYMFKRWDGFARFL